MPSLRKRRYPIAARRSSISLKTGIKFLLAASIIGAPLMPPDVARGQALTVLHTFAPVSGPAATNTEGANPSGGLSWSGGTLYGTATYGGGWGRGTVFAMDANGGGFIAAHNFTGGSDGANPLGGVTLSNKTLYGTASAGALPRAGTEFRVGADGTGFTSLRTCS